MPQLVLHRSAAHYFERLDERIKAQVRAKLISLADSPFTAVGVKPMQGEWKGFYRLRHGDLRIIYTVDKATDRLIVAPIGPRGDVYK
ncbi:MAG TPA: type II toxin-antitoxin system RelE/ParE family toxin [Verrucomicrobiae bacterium]|nr:type II toxin-antitoxin system RelE/ParE family toxin [Verrucomicrobiae bacterium]